MPVHIVRDATMDILATHWPLEIFVNHATVTETQIHITLTGVITEQVNAWNALVTQLDGNVMNALKGTMEIHCLANAKHVIVTNLVQEVKNAMIWLDSVHAKRNT